LVLSKKFMPSQLNILNTDIKNLLDYEVVQGRKNIIRKSEEIE